MPKDKKKGVRPAAKSMAEAIAEEKRKRGMPDTPSCSRVAPSSSQHSAIKKKRKLKQKPALRTVDYEKLQRGESDDEGDNEDGSEGAAAVVAAVTPHLLNIAPALVKYREKRMGRGDGCVMARSNVVIEYTGRLAATGFVFDRSKASAPLQFRVGADAVVEGFEDGVLGMKMGGERTIHVPPEFGYGRDGFPACKIPPNAELEFDVRLLGLSQ